MGEMDTDQLYSVRWNEFHTSIITSFRHLLDQEDFIDVTIACEGQSFTAHKVVLSACSPYFRSLLKANPCQHPIIILRDVKKKEMEALLSFMYNGEVRINQENLPEFLKTAKSLQVRGLVDFTKENQPSSWECSSVIPIEIVGKTKSGDNLTSPPYKRQRNNSDKSAQALTPSSNFNVDKDKDTPSLLVQALELNQNQPNQSKISIDSSVTGHSSDEEDSNSRDSDGSGTVNDCNRTNRSQQDIHGQISQHTSKLEPVDFLPTSGNNHDLHHTSISIEHQSRHSFPTTLSSGVSIINSLQGLPGLLPGPSGIHSNSQDNNFGDGGGGPTMGCYLNATEPKPVCTECGRVYSSVSNLKQHIANVHSATPHWEPCPVCGKHFKTRQYLFNHLLQTHGIRQRGSRMHMHVPGGSGGVGGGDGSSMPNLPSSSTTASTLLSSDGCFSTVKPLLHNITIADIKPSLSQHSTVVTAAAAVSSSVLTNHNNDQHHSGFPGTSSISVDTMREHHRLNSTATAAANSENISSQFYTLNKASPVSR
ncbi:protein tramtrack, beta isoform isoform X2 [Daktulosphaira vitifoliae]|uniref:protein tramtrack, beta isoform isoform X2 n=1 Tax=Daktulosphaira vitifoliae TaxID=58002 RepID=UPI0021AAEF06|nr:protein tramtrack, beta isoform isoform X2 [Daktulosphaira vitifoliae]